MERSPDEPEDAESRGLRPFQAEPLLLARLNRRGVAPAWLLLAVPLYWLVTTWVAGMEGNLRPPTGWSDLLEDYAATFQFEAANRPISQFALFRDIPSMLLLTTCAISLYTSYANLSAISRMNTRLLTSRYPADGSQSASSNTGGGDAHAADEGSAESQQRSRARRNIDEELNQTNNLLAKVGDNWYLILLFCLVLGGFFAWSQTRSGVYYYFAPHSEPSETIVRNAYRGWWASLAPFRFGGVLWWLIGSTSLYLSTTQTLAGWSFASLLVKTRSDVRVDLDPLHADGQGGWSDINRALRTGYWSVVVLLFSLAAVTYLLLPLVDPRILLLLFLLTVAFSVIPIALVLWVLSNSASTARRERHEEILSAARSASSLEDNDSLTRRYYLAEESRRLRDLPRGPSRGIVVAFGVLILAVGILANVVQIADGIFT